MVGGARHPVQAAPGIRPLGASPASLIWPLVGGHGRPFRARGLRAFAFPAIVLLLPQADDVAPDYKTQASALLYGDPYDWDNLDEPDGVAEYLRDYY